MRAGRLWVLILVKRAIVECGRGRVAERPNGGPSDGPWFRQLPDRRPRETRSGSAWHLSRLIDEKVLTTDGARAVPRASSLIQKVMAWRPSVIACDRFRLAELQDAVRGRCIVQPRIQRWSEAGEDLRACQRLAVDGPLSVEPATRLLLTAALAASKVQHDDAGNQRLVKKFRDNSGARRCGRGPGPGLRRTHPPATWGDGDHAFDAL